MFNIIHLKKFHCNVSVKYEFSPTASSPHACVHREYYMALSVSTRDTNIIPRALALALRMILVSRVDTGCDTERAISYYVYHILKHEKVLFCIMNCDVDVVT